MMIINRKSQPREERTIPMTATLREQVEHRRDVIESSLKIDKSVDTGARSYQRGLSDRGEAIRNLRKYQGMLNKDDQARGCDPRESRELWTKADRLRREFLVGMPTRAEMHPAHLVHGNGKPRIDEQTVNLAVHKNLRWDKQNSSKVLEFKRIMRIVAPDRPELANIEYHRPAGESQPKAVLIKGDK